MTTSSNFTKMQQAYVDARVAGHNITRSAQIAGYSPAGADRQGSALEKRGDIKRAIAAGKKHLARSTGGTAPKLDSNGDEPRMKDSYPSSLDLLRATYNNPRMPDSVRIRAAEQALPYEHARIGEAGKKEKQKEKANEVAGQHKFRTKQPPGATVTNISQARKH